MSARHIQPVIGKVWLGVKLTSKKKNKKYLKSGTDLLGSDNISTQRALFHVIMTFYLAYDYSKKQPN